MKKAFSVSPRGIFFGAVGFTLISVILRVLCMLFFFDASIGYYDVGAVLPIISNIFLGVGAIGFTVLAFTFFGRKNQVLEYKKASVFKIITCVFGILAALFTSALSLPAAFGGDRLALLCAALSFTGALYFPCACFGMKTVYQLITGIALIARITIMMGAYYFNQDITMNAPDKIIFCIACIFGMWVIVCEIKAIMGVVRPWIFITAAVGAAAICSTASLPSIITYHASSAFNGGGYGEYWLLLAISVYAIAALSGYSVEVKANTAESEVSSQGDADGDSEAQEGDGE